MKIELTKARQIKSSETYCPHCGHVSRVYKRNFTEQMAKALALISVLSKKGKKYIHVQQEFSKLKYRATAMDYIQLSRWGLIQRASNEKDPTSKDCGYWKTTKDGEKFLRKKTTVVPSFVMVRNNESIYWPEEYVTIMDVLKKKFLYRELFNLN